MRVLPAANTKLLLVDDDEALLTALKRLLSASEPSWQILTARDGKAALELLARESVAVVITDLSMPVLDGFALLKHLAAHHPEMIRVVHSSHSATSREIARAPAHRVVHKPATPTHLLAIARWAVRQSRDLEPASNPG